MNDTSGLPTPLDRRQMFRGGAALAGATAVGLVMASPSAEAVDGNPIELGTENRASTTTKISVARGSAPTLALTNANGPSLYLEPVSNDWDGELALGAVANTTIGPVVGVDLGNGPETVQLATVRDLEALPTVFAIQPVRLVDTRWVGDLIALVRSSPSAFDSKRRLRANAWMDIAVAPSDEGYVYSSAFVNLTVSGAAKPGYLTAYAPGDRPLTSGVNFSTGQTISNSAFIRLDIVDAFYVLRVHTTATTDVVIDVTGVIVSADTSTTPTTLAKTSLRRRQQRQAKVAGEIRRSLGAGANR